MKTTDVVCPICGDFLEIERSVYTCPSCKTCFTEKDLEDYLRFVDEDDFMGAEEIW